MNPGHMVALITYLVLCDGQALGRRHLALPEGLADKNVMRGLFAEIRD